MALPADPGGTPAAPGGGLLGDYTKYEGPMMGPSGYGYYEVTYSGLTGQPKSYNLTQSRDLPGSGGSGGSTSYVNIMGGQLGANRYTTYTDSSGNLWQVDNLDGSQSIIQKAPSNANPADKNNDGLDDTTNMALGVYPSKLSWTGYAYGNGVEVWPNGAPAGPNPNPPAAPAPPKASTAIVQTSDGSDVLIDTQTGNVIRTIGGPTPVRPTTTSSGSSGGSSGGGSSAPVRDWAGEQAAQNAFEAAQAELNRQFQREMNAAKTEADLAIAEMNYAINLRKLGLDEKQFGVDAAETFGRLASSTDPLAFASFLHAGGGNIMNALSTGADALSSAALLPGARALQAMRGLGSTPTGGTPPAAGGGGGEPTPTPAAPPPATPPAGETDGPVARPANFTTTAQARVGRNNQANYMAETLNNYAQMSPEALRILAQTDPLAASYLGLGGSDTVNRYVTDMNALRTQVGGSYGPNMEGYQPTPMAGWNEPQPGGYPTSTTPPPPPPPQTGPGSLSTAVSGINAGTGQVIGGPTPPPNDTPNASWNGTKWVMPDGTDAPTTLTNKAVVPMYAKGTMRGLGYVNHGMMGVGDAPGPNPTANGARPEIIVNPTNAPIGVIPTPQARQMMRGLSVPPPRFAEGTDVDWSLYNESQQYNPYIMQRFASTQPMPAATTTATPTTTSPTTQPTAPAPTQTWAMRQPDGTVQYGSGAMPTAGTTPAVPTAPTSSISDPALTTPPATTTGGTTANTAIGANVPTGGGYGVTPLTDAQLGVTPGDIPTMEEVLGLRQGTQVPALNYYDIGFNDVGPTLQQMYFSGLQGKYGIPQQDAIAEWNKYRMRGLSGGNLALGV